MDEITQTANPGSKKIWYIVGGVAVLLLLGWFFMRGVGGMAGVDVDRNVDGSATYTSDEGVVTVGSNTMPANWPSDAPDNAAGATITFSGTSNPQTGEVGSALSYTVRGSVQSVSEHYRSELAAKGWTVEGTAAIGGATVVSAKKDTRTFGAYIADAGDGQVTVTAGIGM